MHTNRSVTKGLLLIAMIVLLRPSSGTAQSLGPCEGPQTTTTTDVQLFGGPPTFSTGEGWRLSIVKQVLPKGMSVRVCERLWVGFVFGKKLWLRITSEKGEGWIPGENTVAQLLKGSTQGERWTTRDRTAFFWISPAYAEVSEVSTPAVPNKAPFYLFAFIALLMGMAMKGLFDYVEQGIVLKPYLRQTSKAFMVSPIVFLGFAQTGNIALNDTAFLVFLCFAFQNGFFWQTILVRKTSPVPSAVAGDALTTA